MPNSLPDQGSQDEELRLRKDIRRGLRHYKEYLPETPKGLTEDEAVEWFMQLIQADRQDCTVAVDDEGLRERIHIFLAVMDIMDNWYHAATRHHLVDVGEAKPMIDEVVNMILARDVQLKEQLLDEVEKRVIGADDVDTGYGLVKAREIRVPVRNSLRNEQRTALNKLRRRV